MCLFNAARVIVKGSLVSTISLPSRPFLWFSCILPAITNGSSLDNNPTYAGYAVNCHKMLIQIRFRTTKDAKMTKLGKRESRETMSVVCHYINFSEVIVLTRFTTRVIIIWEVLHSYFSSYCKLFIFKIPGFRHLF